MQARVDIRWHRAGYAGKIEWKARRNEFTAPLLTADHFQIVRREHAGEREEARLRPFAIKEVIVATGAFHARAQKNLRRIRGSLNGLSLRGVQNKLRVDVIVAVLALRLRMEIRRAGGIDEIAR